jgi:hypothetical protein
MFSSIWHKNLTLNPSPIREGLAPSPIGEGVGDEVKLSQFTINLTLNLFHFIISNACSKWKVIIAFL